MEEFNIQIKSEDPDTGWDIEVTGRKEERTMIYGSTLTAHKIDQEEVLDVVDYLMFDISADWPT